MIDKNKVIQLQTQGLNYQAIANLMGVSRARIHQIISGYSSGKIKQYKEVILRRDNFTCQMGEKCSSECQINNKNHNLIIHHIDGNDRNNNYSNLITLCLPCHSCYHLTKAEKNLKKHRCKKCGQTYNSKSGDATFCFKCSNKIKKEKSEYWDYYHKLKGCIKCGTNKIKHHSKGLCKSCIQKKRYADPLEKEKHALVMKKYWIKNKSILIEKNKKYQKENEGKIKKYRKKYYLKNKNRIKAYLKKRYKNKQLKKSS